MDAIPIIGPIFGFFGKMAEIGAWARAFDLATGDHLYATLALAPMAIIILALWRLPKLGRVDLSGFTGKVALVAVVGLLAITALAFLLVIYNREIEPHLGGDPGPAQPRAITDCWWIRFPEETTTTASPSGTERKMPTIASLSSPTEGPQAQEHCK